MAQRAKSTPYKQRQAHSRILAIGANTESSTTEHRPANLRTRSLGGNAATEIPGSFVADDLNLMAFVRQDLCLF